MCLVRAMPAVRRRVDLRGGVLLAVEGISCLITLLIFVVAGGNDRARRALLNNKHDRRPSSDEIIALSAEKPAARPLGPGHL